MDLERFRRLSEPMKMGYVSMKLEQARSLMQIIYDSCCSLIADDTLKELETLSDDFVGFGIAAEEGRSVEIFNELNDRVGRLEEIAALIRRYAAN